MKKQLSSNQKIENETRAVENQRATVLQDADLNNAETYVDPNPITDNDSLVVALRDRKNATEYSVDENEDGDQLHQLAHRIEQLVPQEPFEIEDLLRFIDSPESPEEIGRFGRYQVVELISSASMGLVVRGIDRELDREVCIKFLNPNYLKRADAVQRFDREIRTVARMNCERIVSVLEVGNEKGLPYFAMPMLNGMSLRAAMGASQFDQGDCLNWIRQIAEGLSYAHLQNCLHRDIKPENIWITETGDVKLLDFGLARIEDETTPVTKNGTVLGTPSYMSPEQVTGKELDARSDLFSLGVVWLEMLTGRTAFQQESLFSTLMSVVNDRIDFDLLDPDQAISQPVRDLICELLAKDPDSRLDSAQQLINRLDRLENDYDQATAKIQSDSVNTRSGTRWFWSVTGVFSGIVFCIAAFAFYNANDKGTLVVRSDDPNVEIIIKNETVKVYDPLIERTYEIKIGETRLPSGTYQLETSDASGNLKFSSQTIAIRRGQQTIVEVELKPTHQGNEKSTSAKSDLDNRARSPAEEWRDQSYDRSAKNEFALRLERLPRNPILLESVDGFGLLSKYLSVTEPSKIEGVGAWSLEQPSINSRAFKYNCDRSLKGRISTTGNYLELKRINSRSILIPCTNFISKFEFDNQYPNLVAVVETEVHHSQIGDGNFSRHLKIWRISENSASLVGTVENASQQITWDRGYRIGFMRNNELWFYWLDTHQERKAMEINESGRLSSISPNGRFVAFSSRSGRISQVNFYDLKRLKFHHALVDCHDFKWKDDSRQIAYIPYSSRSHSTTGSPSKSELVFWDVANTQELFRRLIDPSAFGIRGLRSDFKLLAGHYQNDLLLRDIQTNQVRAMSLIANDKTWTKVKNKSRAKISWFDHLTVALDHKEFKANWNIKDDEMKVLLEHTKEEQSSQSALRRSITALTVNDSLLRILEFVRTDNRQSESTSYQFSLDEISKNGIGPVPVFLGSRDASDPSLIQQGNHALFDGFRVPNECFCPQGKHYVALRNDLEDKPELKPFEKFEIRKLAWKKLDPNTNPPKRQSRSSSNPFLRVDFAWTKNGHYLLIYAGSQNRESKKMEGILVDVVNNKSKAIDSFGIDPMHDIELLVHDDKILLVGSERKSTLGVPTQLEYPQFWTIDFESGTAQKLRGLDKKMFVKVEAFFGDVIFFLAASSKKLHQQSEDVNLLVGRITDAGIETQLLCKNDLFLPLAVWLPSNSNNQEYTRIIHERRGVKIQKVMIHDLIDQSTVELLHESIASEMFPVLNPKSKRIAWYNDRELCFEYFDGKNLSMLGQRHWLFDMEPQLFASEFGWWIYSTRGLMALSHQGKVLGYALYMKDGEPAANAKLRWVLKDGALQEGVDTEGMVVVFVKGDEVITVPVKQFEEDPFKPDLPKFKTVPFLKND